MGIINADLNGILKGDFEWGFCGMGILKGGFRMGILKGEY